MSRKTKELMYPLIETWEVSDYSKTEYCHIHGVNITTFIYWERKYRADCLSEAEEKFVELRVSDIKTESKSKNMEICYANGVRIRFEQELSGDFLAALIKIAD